tara:strand:+ start:185 stop:394 length:210 start_codon:yes stop_codon:yes gene_type:complete
MNPDYLLEIAEGLLDEFSEAMKQAAGLEWEMSHGQVDHEEAGSRMVSIVEDGEIALRYFGEYLAETKGE